MATDATDGEPLEEDLRIDNGALEVAFAGAPDGGCGLRSLAYDATGHAFSAGAVDDPLWELEFRDAAGYRDVLDSANAESFEAVTETTTADEADDETDGESETVLRLRWTDLDLEFPGGDAGSVDVELRIRLPADEATSYWRPSVEIDADEVTLWRVTFPAFANLRRDGGDRSDDRLLLPDGWGAYVSDPVSTDEDDLFTWNITEYPTGSMAMQFLAFENAGTGLYLGFHDDAGGPKEFDVGTDADADALSVRVNHRPEGMGDAQSSWDPGYELAVGCYAGDWYDAAERYREWALEAADWTRRGPIEERTDVPDWIREAAVWWSPGFASVSTDHDTAEQSLEPADLEEKADAVLELDDAIPAPTACHWYHWQEIAYDTDYPDYFPAREGFADVVERVQEGGVSVMPYINGRLADPNGRTWRERGLEDAAAVRASARYDPGHRAPQFEEYGNGQLLSPMCPVTETWRETITDTVERLVDDVGVDGVYVDQLAAAPPAPCFDPDHDHPSGGGSESVETVRAWLETLTDGVASEAALTSECNAEPYASGLSAHLLWHSARPEAVPLYPAVYGEYALAFGRSFFAFELEGTGAAFASKLGQQFDFGGQLGWITLPVGRALLAPENEALRSYLATTAEALHAGREYLTTGRRRRDPRPVDVPASTEVVWESHHRDRRPVELEPLLVSLWERTDGSLAVAATNWTDDAQSGTWAFPAVEAGGSALELEPRSETGIEAESTADGDGPAVTLEAPPRSSAVFALEGATIDPGSES